MIRYYLALREAENGVTATVTPFFCIQREILQQAQKWQKSLHHPRSKIDFHLLSPFAAHSATTETPVNLKTIQYEAQHMKISSKQGDGDMREQL